MRWLFVLLFVLIGCKRENITIDGLVFFEVKRGHTDKAVTYPMSPPVGGIHSPLWQNCGVYREEINPMNAVHSLEHGAVWITYNKLTLNEENALRGLAGNHAYLLVSPYKKQTSRLVLNAWGVQLALDSTNDPRIPLFFERFMQGRTTPELGASCSGGIGNPTQ
jgi:hypothetical protein